MPQHKNSYVTVADRYGESDFLKGSRLLGKDNPSAFQYFEMAASKLERAATNRGLVPQNKISLLEKALECNQRLWTEAEYRQENGLPWYLQSSEIYFSRIKAIKDRLELLNNPKLIN